MNKYIYNYMRNFTCEFLYNTCDKKYKALKMIEKVYKK